jgi:hypothetical protein
MSESCWLAGNNPGLLLSLSYSVGKEFQSDLRKGDEERDEKG